MKTRSRLEATAAVALIPPQSSHSAFYQPPGNKSLPEAAGKTVDPNFAQNHLSVTPAREVWWNDRCDELLAEIWGVQKGFELKIL